MLMLRTDSNAARTSSYSDRPLPNRNKEGSKFGEKVPNRSEEVSNSTERLLKVKGPKRLLEAPLSLGASIPHNSQLHTGTLRVGSETSARGGARTSDEKVKQARTVRVRGTSREFAWVLADAPEEERDDGNSRRASGWEIGGWQHRRG